MGDKKPRWRSGAPLLAAVGLLLLVGLWRTVPAWPVGGTPEKVAYLTYDDGPSPNTPHLLEVLREEGAPATFFVIGREEDPYPEIYREILAQGHALGLHSYSHRYREIYRSVEDFTGDIARLEELLLQSTGTSPTIMRFPGGSANYSAPNQEILNQIIRHMADQGYQYFDWNVVSGDDTATVYPPEVLAQNVLKAIKGKDSVVVLFHDAPLCTTTAEASRIVIQQLREEGYRLDLLTPETPPIHLNSAGRSAAKSS